MSTQLTPMESAVFAIEDSFNAVNAYKMNFRKEAGYALQILKANDYLRSAAQSDPSALEAAITRVASVGITLSPYAKEAYLVPRSGKVVLDITAIGLLKLATDSGAILWGQARLVYEKDTYENRGVSKEPVHGYNAFGNRGKCIGVYVVAKTAGGDFLTEEMSIEDCHKIRDRSEAWKAFAGGKTKSCPWATDEGEMMKKTVIKRASKLWPKSERLDTAVSVLNEHEGIDFSKERASTPHISKSSLEAPEPTEKDFQVIRERLAAKGKTEAGLLSFMNDRFGTNIDRLEDMTNAQVAEAYKALGGRPEVTA